jgi:uncharacterized protein (TIGR03437 family)
MMASDAAGNIYVADSDNYRVRKVSPDGIITTVAGNGVRGDDGDGGPATRARLTYPLGVAVGPQGTLYISDYEAHRVRKVTPDGTISTIAGTGLRGFSGDGGPATSAQLHFPEALVVDAAARIFVSDSRNFRIRRIDPDGTIHTVAGRSRAGSLGVILTPELRGDGGPATQAAFSTLGDIGIDAGGNLYISDLSDHRIRRVGADGVIQTVVGPVNGSTFPAEGVPALSTALPDFFGIHVMPDGTTFCIVRSTGIFVGKIYRVGADQILHLVLQEEYLDYGRRGSVLVTSSEKIYQTGWGRIYVTSNGKPTVFAGVSDAGFAGDGGSGRSAMLNNPAGLAVDGTGNLLIADSLNRRVRKLNREGVIGTVVGTGVYPYPATAIGDGGPATSAALAKPTSLGIDRNGGIYVGDEAGYRVRKVGADGTITTFAGTGESGREQLPLVLPAPATSLTIDVASLAVNSTGNVFVGDASERRAAPVRRGAILNVTLDGMAHRVADFQNRMGYNDGNGRVFVNASDELFVLRPHGGAVEKIAADGQSSTRIPLSGDLLPGALNAFTYDKSGNLYVAGKDSPIRKISPAGEVSTVLGGSSPNIHHGDGPAFHAVPPSIHSLVTDDSGNLYFSETARSRVRMIPGASTCQGAIYPLVAWNGIVNAASYRSGIAPGEMISIFGVNLGPQEPAFGKWDDDGRLATTIGGTRVLFDGVPAPMVYASQRQVNAIVPYEMYGRTSAEVTVEWNGFPSEKYFTWIAEANPGFFTMDASGKGQAAALNVDYSVNGPSNPAKTGSVIVLYVTGEGQTDPPGVNGLPAGAALPRPKLPVRVQIGGMEAEVQYAGGAPYFSSGLMQVNAKIPSDAATGEAVPVLLWVGEKSSQSDVTIAVVPGP